MTVVNKVYLSPRCDGFELTKGRGVVRRLGVTIHHEFPTTLYPVYGVRRLCHGGEKIEDCLSPQFRCTRRKNLVSYQPSTCHCDLHRFQESGKIISPDSW